MKITTLLFTEWLKFKNNSLITFLAMMFVIFMPLTIFIGKEFENVPPPLPDNSIFFEFPSMWSYLGYIGSWMVFFFVGLMMIFMITQEVGYKTLRQNIINGYTRQDFFFAKVSLALFMSLAATLIYFILGLSIGFYHTENADWALALDNDWAVLRYFIMCMSYCAMGFFIAILTRRSGIAVMLYLSYIIIIEHLLKWGVHFNLLGLKNKSLNYYPANAIEDIMPNPLFRYSEAIPRKDLNFDFLLSYTEATMVSTVYILVFFSLSYYLFLKRDI